MEATEEVQKTVPMLGENLNSKPSADYQCVFRKGTEEVRASHSMVLSKA